MGLLKLIQYCRSDCFEGQLDAVRSDIKQVVDAVKGKAIVKVIMETDFLNDEQKAQLADFRKKQALISLKPLLALVLVGLRWKMFV